jgi:hypothetical protein
MAAAFTIPAAYTPNLALSVACLSAAMYFVNLASGAGWALVSVSAPRRLVATLGSFMNFGGYLAGAAAPIITGFIADKTGHFVMALVIAAGIAILGAVANAVIVKDPIAEGDTLELSPATAWVMRGVALLAGTFVGFLADSNKGALIGLSLTLIGLVVARFVLRKDGAAQA